MTSPARSLTTRARNPLPTVAAIAAILGRYGLVIVIGWIGALTRSQRYSVSSR
jgi:cell division inhibitor SulA